ncbi:hypothetical protein GCM10020000_78710 [Streptomyces olivoverticillatus]
MAAPLGCSVQTGVGTVRNVLRPSPGTALAVFGAGSVGLSAVMAAVAEGCTVVAVDPIASRRALAEELGAAATIDPGAEDDVAAALCDLTHGGPRHAIDTTGQPVAVSQAISALRKRGTLALVGIGMVDFATMPVMTKGLTIKGVTEGDVVPSQTIPPSSSASTRRANSPPGETHHRIPPGRHRNRRHRRVFGAGHQTRPHP